MDGGYTQGDVTEFAKVITGWSIGGGEGRLRGGDPGRFYFRSDLHEPGARNLLGRQYGEDGVGQGEAVLRDLARAPATARHVATKLARHFVADDPPPAAIDHLSQVFLSTNGDLPSVYRALIDRPEAWAQPLSKFKTPSDYIISSFRALSLPVPDGAKALAPFELLGQRTFLARLARRLAGPVRRIGTALRRFSSDWNGPTRWDSAWARWSMPAIAPPRCWAPSQAITPARRLRTPSRGAQALTLLLVSPEFMRR